MPLTQPTTAQPPSPPPDVPMAHYKAIVQSTDDAVISKTLYGIVTSWNPGAQAMFGYTADEMVGSSLLRLFPPDRVDEEAAILQKIMAGETVDHFETVRITKEGRLLNVSVTISPIRDDSGTIVGASKIARNITERKASDVGLRLAASVFSDTSEGIAITDTQGTLLVVNNAFEHITGHSRADVLGQSPRMFRSSRQGPETYAQLWEQLMETGRCRGEVWSRRKDGEAYAVLLTVNAVKNDAGQTVRYVALFSDITPLRRQQEQLEHVANFDPLTDLPNRLLLSDRLTQGLAQCRRTQQGLAVLYLDLDGFKAINDRHGHDMGDQLLIALSQRMKHALRDTDSLARMGGDEFVAVLVNVLTPQDCAPLIERLLHACAHPIVVRDVLLQVSASIGVALYPQDNADVDLLIRHADQAMYQAKQAGKNRYHLFNPDHQAELQAQQSRLTELRQALTGGEFVLHYQPKVNMRTGALVGVEALVRWQHPTQGLLAPAAFLPSLEGHPLSDQLADWVLQTALEQMCLWQQQGERVPVSVNVGGQQLQQRQLAVRLAELLARYTGISPRDLELEILETSALHDLQEVSATMRECHHIGVRFAVDDFGTGYSSLTYLKRLPAATLKIDRSFVRDMLDDHEDLAIVQGVIGLAQAFGRTVIAEGVETEAHGQKLLALGCELAQGFGIARPMPADQLLPWLATWRPFDSWTGPPAP